MSPNGDNAPVRSAATSLTAWSSGVGGGPAVSTYGPSCSLCCQPRLSLWQVTGPIARRAAALRWSTMTEHTPGVPLGAWLADLPDSRLVRMLELRPDLAQPPPGSIAALAARAQARQSVRAATDDLNFLHLAVLEALLVLHADTAAVPFSAAGSGDGRSRTAARDRHHARRSSGPCAGVGRHVIRVVAEAAAGLPWYPGQVILDNHAETRPTSPGNRALGDTERELLHRLLEGSPVGRTRTPRRHPTRPAGTTTAGGRPSASAQRRNGDPAPPGWPDASRPASRPGSLQRPRPRSTSTTTAARRRRGCRWSRHRPAARVRPRRSRPSAPHRYLNSAVADSGPRYQAADQADGC